MGGEGGVAGPGAYIYIILYARVCVRVCMCIYSKTLTSFVQTIIKNVSVLGSGLSAVA